MGVDAEIRVKTATVLTDRQVMVLAREMAEAIGPAHFWFQRDSGRHCVTRSEMDGDGQETDDPCWLDVRIGSRYYGPGYERGNLPVILAVCRYLATALPGAHVFYGGDSDDELSEMTPALEAELWAHFVAHGHRTYRGGFDAAMRDDGLQRPAPCSLCEAPMMRCGRGHGYGRFACLGCGLELQTRDGGHTYAPPKD